MSTTDSNNTIQYIQLKEQLLHSRSSRSKLLSAHEATLDGDLPRRGVLTLRWCVGRREVGSPETQFLTQRSNGQELILTGLERTGELGQRFAIQTSNRPKRKKVAIDGVQHQRTLYETVYAPFW
jgi:hypothetical protein